MFCDTSKSNLLFKYRKNPWFNKNLPAYLRPLPNTEESGNLLIDDDLVFELSKVEFIYRWNSVMMY